MISEGILVGSATVFSSTFQNHEPSMTKVMDEGSVFLAKSTLKLEGGLNFVFSVFSGCFGSIRVMVNA
jgi:hypothetical protein